MHTALPLHRWLLCVAIAVLTAAFEVEAREQVACRCVRHACRCAPEQTREGTADVARTRRFVVRSLRSDVRAEEIARICEELNSDLGAYWFGNRYFEQDWETRCEVWVHANLTAYETAVGRGSGSTSGSTLIERQQGKVISRRIDLRSDATDWKVSALPHELTHVLFADRYGSSALPRWLDEGIAIQVEPVEKRERRRLELSRAVSRGEVYALATLVAESGQPAGPRRGAFYGQSGALVEFLRNRGTDEQFVKFLDLGREHGFETALAKVYGFRSFREIEPLVLRQGIAPVSDESPRGIVDEILVSMQEK